MTIGAFTSTSILNDRGKGLASLTEQRYRVLILGNVDLASLDLPENAPKDTSYASDDSGSATARAAAQADACVVNLEQPLVKPSKQLRSKRRRANRLPRVNPEQAIAKLRALGVTGANLANDHSLDYGASGLQLTSRRLRRAGITPFGAGSSIEDARTPFQISLPESVGGGKLAFYGSFQYSRMYDRRLGFYADQSSAGSAPISASTVSDLATADQTPDTFHVAFPHWGPDQGWRSYEQYQIAHRFLRKGYHLVLGHGSPTLQEIERQLQRWVFYGIGDGDATNPQGGHRPTPGEHPLPFSSWTILEVVKTASGARSLNLKLYPLSRHRSGEGTHSEPVSEDELLQVANTLTSRATNGWRFNNPAQAHGKDDLGNFLCFQLGEWPENQAPSLLPPLAEHGDPGNWTIQTAPAGLVDSFLDLDKISMGASMYALQAEMHGGKVDWLTPRHAKITCGDKTFIAYGYVANESALGVTISANKVLTSQFLMKAGVQTPLTTPVSSADEAVDAARRLGSPVVVKPSDGKKSRGVTTDLRDDDAIRDAFHRALQHGSQVLVQQYIQTEEEVRVIATPDVSIAVIKRVLPHVIGDGVSTIQQLIEDKNLQRELNPSMRKRPIPLDGATETYLARQEYSLQDVPDSDLWVTVRNVAGLSAGADPFEAFETTSQKVKDTAAAAVAAIPGLGWGGVDVILEKHTGEPYVVEINTDAGYGQAMFPTYGTSRNVAEIAWEERYRTTAQGPSGSVPPLTLLPSAEPALPKRAPNGRTYSRALLSTAFNDFLAHSRFNEEALSTRVRRLTSPEGLDVLITQQMMTSADRSSAARVVRHHAMVRQLLSLDDLQLPRGRSISSTRGLHKYLDDLTHQVVLIPPLGAWMGEASEVLDVNAARARKRTRSGTFVQTRRRGTRMRVLATQSEVLTVITAQPQRVDEDSIADSSDLAVRAVRAVPELRWAAVYILVLPSGQYLIEGLSLNPRLTAQDVVVAGGIDDFFTWIITGKTLSPGDG